MYRFYYINMKDSPIRNKLMTNSIGQLYNTKSEFIRYEAFDNKLLDDKMIRVLIQNGYLTPETNIKSVYKHKVKLSIYMSHLLLWNKILNKYKAIPLGKRVQVPQYIILEDDIKIKFNIEILLDRVYKYIPRDYDILFLGNGGKLRGQPVNEYIVKPVEGQHRETNHGLFGYMINPNSIEKMTKLLLPIDSLYIMGNWQVEGNTIPHMDWKIRHFYNKGINAYYLKHPIIHHLDEFDFV